LAAIKVLLPPPLNLNQEKNTKNSSKRNINIVAVAISRKNPPPAKTFVK
jgi:hypothetical protein